MFSIVKKARDQTQPMGSWPNQGQSPRSPQGAVGWETLGKRLQQILAKISFILFDIVVPGLSFRPPGFSP